MTADREERHIRAWTEGIRRAVASEMSQADLGRLATAAMGDDEPEVGEPVAMGDPLDGNLERVLELPRR